ncbi:MAG: tRNA pseudouridine(38-40) synthase TruA [Clostridia bacterium]|nr:tRNA pseudouridine(38-40) synthase TruA [Clostridia bacterium]
MNYLALIQYVGTDFCGYQVQPNRRTVQGELCRAFAALFGCACRVSGCSRTDSGVHAEEFCILIEPENDDHPFIPPHKLPLAIMVHLPRDISVIRCIEAPCGFHPRYEAQGKIYRYDLWNAPVGNPFLVDRAWHYPKRLDDGALARMQAAAERIVGKQDFAAFMADGSAITDTVRTVFSCTCVREGDFVRIRVHGDGFLYNMVRIIVGTLLAVGTGKLEPGDVSTIIQKKKRVLAGMTAPACGLTLEHVIYPKERVAWE